MGRARITESLTLIALIFLVIPAFRCVMETKQRNWKSSESAVAASQLPAVAFPFGVVRAALPLPGKIPIGRN
jgi:hypothetical protein